MSTERQDVLDNAKTVIVKIGTNAITDSKGELNTKVIRSLVKDIAVLKQQGKQVLLVSSGAIGCGRSQAGIFKKNLTIPEKQALSATGQIHLMHFYSTCFKKYNLNVSQLLVSDSSLNNRNQYHNLSNCINKLLELNTIPIINENDAIATQELSIGDNDTIAALISTRIGADVLLLLTSVDGVLDAKNNVIPIVDNSNIGDVVEHKGLRTSLGTGGIQSKLSAAKLASSNGTAVLIANGTKNKIINTLFANNKSGTYFPPKGSKLKGKRKWIVASLTGKTGSVRIDAGAAKAITQNGKSLLPAGIKSVKGSFKAGDVIRICDSKGKDIAAGMTNYDSAQCEEIKGKHSREISTLYKNNSFKEIIHRDNLVIID